MHNLPLPRPSTPATPKKTGIGCIVALTFVGGVATLLAGLAVVFALSPMGQRMFGPTKVLLDAQKAPGTKELRALGCVTPSVLDLEEQRRAFDRALGRRAAGNVEIRVLSIGAKVTCAARYDATGAFLESIPERP